ncbi:MAG: efflux RND transporter permease subunit [Ketobacteraceae bacterium]|nr:efflux RND transporter permease subunit [Ketobacteraceae bacterium]
MLASLVDTLFRKRKLLSVLAMLLLVAGSAFLARLSLDNHFSIFFDAQDVRLQEYNKIQKEFVRTDNVLVAIAPAEGEVFNPAFVTRLRRFTEASWQVPFVKRVDSITNYQHVFSTEGGITIRSLASGDGDNLDMDLLRERTLSEKDLVGALIDPQGQVTGVNLLLDMPKDPAAPADVMSAVRQLMDEHFLPEDQVHVHGIVALNNAFMEATERDGMTLMPLMFLVISVLLMVLLGSWRAAAGVLLVVTLGSWSVVVAIAAFGFDLNMVNVVAITIVMTLAVADCVHLVSTYQEALKEGMTPEVAARQSLSVNFVPVLITSLTTAIGFLALLFSNSPPIRELGIVTATGVLSVFVFSVTVFVWLLPVISVKHREAPGFMDQWMHKLAEGVLGRRVLVVVGFALVSPILVFLAFTNEINDHASHYFSKDAEFAKSTAFISDHLTGLDTLSFELATGEGYGINEVGYIEKLSAFGEWLASQPEVVHVKSYVEVLKRINQYTHGGDADYYRLPDSKKQASQFLLLYSMSTTFGLGIEDRVNFDQSATRIEARLAIDNPREMLSLTQKAEAWVEQNWPGVQLTSSSVPKLFADIGIENIRSMLQGNFFAVLAIALLLVVAFGSWRFGLVSVLPNLVPALVALGIWALISAKINLAASIVFAVTLGIIVDDSVHFIHKYLLALRGGRSPEDAIRYAFANVGRALVVTTLVLGLGFAMLGFSDFAVNSVMGILVCITLVVALVVDLLFLPLVLLWLGKRKLLTGDKISASS